MYMFITVNFANLYIHVISGVARVIVFGRQAASGEGILGGPPHFYTDLDFSNGLEHNWGCLAPPPPPHPPLNYTTACNHKIQKYHNFLYKLLINNIVKNFNVLSETNIIVIA